tara:strand:- start:289 stop:501 length:213 start_codon:yes stop_codon:yes gene_type:complete
LKFACCPRRENRNNENKKKTVTFFILKHIVILYEIREFSQVYKRQKGELITRTPQINIKKDKMDAKPTVP